MNCMPMFVALSIGYFASFEVPLHSSHAPLAKEHICPLLPRDWPHLLHFIGPLLAAQSLVNKATQTYLDKTCLPKWHKISNLVWKHFCAALISKQNRNSGKGWVHCDALNSYNVCVDLVDHHVFICKIQPWNCGIYSLTYWQTDKLRVEDETLASKL